MDAQEKQEEHTFLVLLTVFGSLFAGGLSQRSALGIVSVSAGSIGLILLLVGKRFRNIVRALPVRKLLSILASIGVMFVVASVFYQLRQIQDDLNSYVMPRTVTSDQATEIRNTLFTNPSEVPVNVFSSSGDPEAVEYAGQITDAISGGGWNASFRTINPWEPTDDPDKNGGDFHAIYVAIEQGIAIRTCIVGQPTNPDPKHPTPDATLSMALTAAHIQAGSASRSNCLKYSVVIEVGRRPVVINREPTRLYRIGRSIINLSR